MKRCLPYLPMTLVAIGILYVSLLREPSFRLPDFMSADKVVHVLMYLALYLAAPLLGFREKRFYPKQTMCIAIVLLVVCAAFGGLIEVAQEQWFYPRTGSWGDWFADVIGAGLGFLMYVIIWIRATR